MLGLPFSLVRPSTTTGPVRQGAVSGGKGVRREADRARERNGSEWQKAGPIGLA